MSEPKRPNGRPRRPPKGNLIPTDESWRNVSTTVRPSDLDLRDVDPDRLVLKGGW